MSSVTIAVQVLTHPVVPSVIVTSYVPGASTTGFCVSAPETILGPVQLNRIGSVSSHRKGQSFIVTCQNTARCRTRRNSDILRYKNGTRRGTTRNSISYFYNIISGLSYHRILDIRSK